MTSKTQNHTKRLRAAVALAACGAVLAGAAALADSSDKSSTTDSSKTGTGGGSSAGSASASASAWGRTPQDGYVRVEGKQARSGNGTFAKASTAGGRGVAEARADVTGVSLFNDLVTADSIHVEARAKGGEVFRSGRVENLQADGRSLGSASSSAIYNLDEGTLTVLSEGRGITGLKLKLTRDYKGSPAGSSAEVAFASARAKDAPAPTPAINTTGGGTSGGGDSGGGGAGATSGPALNSSLEAGAVSTAPPPRRTAPSVTPSLTGSGYVFPAYGSNHSYSNDFGGAHSGPGREGTNVYAPVGTPLLAVTSGQLYEVGTRAVPGNRLWLKNASGDTFYYAHLSAFSRQVQDGTRVKAGQVIGFTGATGNVQGARPRLYFEIHPGDGTAVNPYPFLRAWEQRRDVPQGAWLARYGNDPGSRPGSLVVLKDFLDR